LDIFVLDRFPLFKYNNTTTEVALSLIKVRITYIIPS